MKFKFAYELVRKTGLWLRETVEHAPIRPETKTSHQDIVTEFDKKTEEIITAGIHSLFPDDVVVGEETWKGEAAESVGVWYLDPIDGTSNFASQQMNYAVSLGYYESGKAVFGLVYDVSADVMYHAASGQGAFYNGKPIRTTAGKTELCDMFIYSPIVLETFDSAQPYGAAMQALAADTRARGVLPLSFACWRRDMRIFSFTIRRSLTLTARALLQYGMRLLLTPRPSSRRPAWQA